MIFVKLILGGFGIFMSNMSQVQNILLFQGCDKIVLRLHTAGTESPDTPKHIRVTPISMNVTQTPPDAHQTTPRHPPDTHQTSPGSRRCQQTTTDTNRQPQTPKDTDKCCLSTSGGVCWRLLSSVVCCLLSSALWRCLVGIWRMSGGYREVSE